MKKTLIPILILLASCTSDPSPFVEPSTVTRTDAPDQQGIVFVLDSTMVDDSETVTFEAKEWEEEQTDIDL